VPDLTGKLAGSEEVRSCFASLWLGYATGGGAGDLTCTVRRLGQRFSAQDTNIKDLILDIAESDAFRSRRVAGPGLLR
jgi:Mn-containing catalase